MQETARPEPIECAEILDLLFLYTTDELESAERERVAAHLEGCGPCRLALEEHRTLNRALPGAFVNRRLFYYSRDN
jgi:anti-sigma factor RsiW